MNILLWDNKGLSHGNGLGEVDLEVTGFNCLHMELHKVTGMVLVDTLADFEHFFLRSFLLSVLRVLISTFNFLRLSERFSFF